MTALSRSALSTRLALAAVILSLLAGAACSSNNNTPTTPSQTITLTTDTFSGTVPVGGSDFHTFNVAQSGELDVTLTAAGPPATISMGLGVGSLVSNACQLITGAFGTFQAGSTAQISGTAGAGTFCVMVYDVGNQAASINYTVSVAHP
jgi:hypothetical protein